MCCICEFEKPQDTAGVVVKNKIFSLVSKRLERIIGVGQGRRGGERRDLRTGDNTKKGERVINVKSLRVN